MCSFAVYLGIALLKSVLRVFCVCLLAIYDDLNDILATQMGEFFAQKRTLTFPLAFIKKSVIFKSESNTTLPDGF